MTVDDEPEGIGEPLAVPALILATTLPAFVLVVAPTLFVAFELFVEFGLFAVLVAGLPLVEFSDFAPGAIAPLVEPAIAAFVPPLDALPAGGDDRLPSGAVPATLTPEALPPTPGVAAPAAVAAESGSDGKILPADSDAAFLADFSDLRNAPAPPPNW